MALQLAGHAAALLALEDKRGQDYWSGGDCLVFPITVEQEGKAMNLGSGGSQRTFRNLRKALGDKSSREHNREA